MPSQDLISSPLLSGKPTAGGALVVRLAVGGEISPNRRGTLARADVVFCDEDAERSILEHTGPGTLVEFVAVNGGREWSRPVSLSRARRLAAMFGGCCPKFNWDTTGWRVVWVASANIDMLADFDQVGHLIEAGGGNSLAPRSTRHTFRQLRSTASPDRPRSFTSAQQL
jgi:hypothetical protein